MTQKCKTCKLFPAIVLICLLAVASVVFSVSTYGEVAYADVELNVLAERYVLGDSVTVKDETVSINGTDTVMTPTVLTPSGKKLPKGTITLDELGKYRVEYRAKVDDGIVKTSESFVVVRSSYSTTSNRSVVKYTTYSDDASSADGLSVSLANGDRLEYNKIINLNNIGAESFVKFFMTPATIGVREVEKVHFVLTDAYDAANTVTVTVWSRPNDTYAVYGECAWVSANSALQTATGLDADNNGTFEYNGSKYRKLVGDLGTTTRFSFYGTPGRVDGIKVDSIAEQTMDLIFDIGSSKVFIPHHGGRNYQPEGLVADLDDPMFFSEIWEGFTTGQVYLSVYCEGYFANKAGIFITDIGGEDLSEDTFADTDAPELTVDFDGYAEDSLPKAKIGLPYKVFKAAASDFYDEDVDISAVVYYNYYSDFRVIVNQENGEFVPYDPGRYVIEYTATDDYGIKTVKTVSVNAVSDKKITVSAVSDGLLTAAGNLNRVDSLAAQNVSGRFVYTAKAVHVSSGAEYETADGEFVPLHSGEYKIIYSYSDYVESGILERTVNITANTSPVIMGENTLPEFLLCNCVYPVPELKAYDLRAESPEEIPYTVSVEEDGNERTVQGNYFAPQASGKVTLRYTADIDGVKSSKEFELDVMDVGYGDRIDMAKYFIGDGTAVAERSGVRLTSSGSAFEFANVLDTIEFEARLRVLATDNASAVSIVLTDTKNESKKLKFTFAFESDNVWFDINGSDVHYAVNYDASSASDYLYIGFDRATSLVTFDGSEYISVRDYLSGKAYEGMSDTARLNVEIESDSTGSVTVLSLNGQTLSDLASDLIAPRLFLSEELQGTRTVGDVVTVPSAVAYDVLDPNVKCIRTVTDPSGRICRSKSGVLLDANCDAGSCYELEIDSFGVYVITFQTVDGKGNLFTDSYLITSVDKTAPQISVGAPTDSVSVGGTVNIDAASVTDNVSAADKLTLKVYVIDTYGVLTEISNGGSFVANRAGIYTVIYFAEDEMQNSAFVTFTVNAQ